MLPPPLQTMAKVARGVSSGAVIIPGAPSFAGAWAVEEASGPVGGPPSSVVCDGSHAYVVLPDPGVLLKVRRAP